VGRSGREGLNKNLHKINLNCKIDFTIVNGENAAGGFGITEKICSELYNAGADVITTGNHLWDQKEISSYIEKDHRLLKPLNSAEGTPGVGYNIYNTDSNEKIIVINLIGNVFMKANDNPFLKIDELMNKLKNENDVKFIFVDFHAEATSEKVAMGHHLNGRVTAVVGTHQHIPTADACILSDGTAYQTDAGMCGDYNSVIGMDKNPILDRFKGQDPKSRFTPALGEATLCGVIVESFSDSFKAKSITPIKFGGFLGD
jgi:hypothetical protein